MNTVEDFSTSNTNTTTPIATPTIVPIGSPEHISSVSFLSYASGADGAPVEAVEATKEVDTVNSIATPILNVQTSVAVAVIQDLNALSHAEEVVSQETVSVLDTLTSSSIEATATEATLSENLEAPLAELTLEEESVAVSTEIVEMPLRTDLLVWLDMEITGQEKDFAWEGIKRHKILEIGVHITDSQLNVIDEGLSLVVHHTEAELEPVMSNYVRSMHRQSGLLSKVLNSTTSLQDAEQQVLAYLDAHRVAPKSSPLCGKNIDTDKNFVDAQLPELSKYLTYRKLDVASFKELVVRQRPEAAAQVVRHLKNAGLQDIKESIAELQFYQKELFKSIA